MTQILVNDAPESFGRLLEQSAALADRLAREAGLRPGDRLVVSLENSREHIRLVLASWRLGLQLITTAPTTSALTFGGILQSCSPRAVAVDAANERLAAIVRDRCEVVVALGDDVAAPALLLGHSVAVPRQDLRSRPDRLGEDWRTWLAHVPAAVFYTSGSTSTAKGVPLYWQRILAKGEAVLGFYGVTPGERVMPILPLSHVYGLYCLVGAASLGADCILYRESASPAALAAGMAARRPGVIICPPILGAFLFGRHGCDPVVRDSLRVLSMGGAATSREQAARILAALPRTRVFLSYGLAETYSTVCCNEISAGGDLGSVGKLRFGAFGEVRDPASGRAVAAGRIGELCIGGSIMEGYVGSHGETFTADGLFRTGDLVRMDADGAISITGRLKEMINAGGLSIYPSEIEDALKQHPAVADCGVFGQQVGDLEVVCAAVALRQPRSGPEQQAVIDELFQHCRAHLALKMLPRRILVVPAIPRGALGKIARGELRAACGLAPAPAAVA